MMGQHFASPRRVIGFTRTTKGAHLRSKREQYHDALMTGWGGDWWGGWVGRKEGLGVTYKHGGKKERIS